MSVKLFSLNIEGDKHFARWIPVAHQHTPDVICLQEVFADDMEFITNELGMTGYFVPLMNIAEKNAYMIAPRGLWGLGYCTKLKHSPPEVHYYAGDAQLKIFHEPEDAARAVVLSTINDQEGKEYTIATTHFTWTPNGEATDAQRTDAEALVSYLQEKDQLVLCGDFNAPRGREVFSRFSQQYKDNLPQNIHSTLDPELHYRGGKVALAVDTIFSSAGYVISDVEVLTGVSDHYGLVARIDCTAETN